MQDNTHHATLGLAVLLALIASVADSHNRATWLLEVALMLIAAPLLLLSYRRFPLTWLLYVLITVHALALILSGVYTYARVPAVSGYRIGSRSAATRTTSSATPCKA